MLSVKVKVEKPVVDAMNRIRAIDEGKKLESVYETSGSFTPEEVFKTDCEFVAKYFSQKVLK